MRRRALLAAALLCVFCLTARADTFRLFNLNARFADGAVATGTVNLDLDDYGGRPNPGPFNSVANFVYTSGSESILFTGRNLSFGYGVTVTDVDFYSSGLALFLYLDVPTVGSLAGYNGGALNSNTVMFRTTSSKNYLASGSLTPVLTPEPSSLVMLGTGVLGLLGFARKRFAA